MARSTYIYILRDDYRPEFLPVAAFTVKREAVKWATGNHLLRPRYSMWRYRDGDPGRPETEVKDWNDL